MSIQNSHLLAHYLGEGPANVFCKRANSKYVTVSQPAWSLSQLLGSAVEVQKLTETIHS